MSSDVVRWITSTSNNQQQHQSLQHRHYRNNGKRITMFSDIGANSDIVFKSSFYKLVFLWLVINVNLILVQGNDRALPLVSMVNDSNNQYSGHFTPTWAVHIPDGDAAATRIANDHGFINLGKVSTKL